MTSRTVSATVDAHPTTGFPRDLKSMTRTTETDPDPRRRLSAISFCIPL
jgi:hypothetical protein